MQKPTLKLKGIRADELLFRVNGVPPKTDGKLELKPAFSRKVRRASGEENIFLLTLSVRIESTPEEPKPFDLTASLTGVFGTDAAGEEGVRAAVVEATQVVFPYLRAAVTGLTSAAMAAPIVLPVIAGPLFPEDREKDDGLFS